MAIVYDDFKLQSECIRGNREAWDFFVRKYSKLVYHAISRTLRVYSSQSCREDIEDIYNGVFLSCIEDDYRKLRQFEHRNGCTLSTWVRLIAVRRTIDFFRGQKPLISIDQKDEQNQSLMETIPDNRTPIDDQVEFSESGKLVTKAIEELSSSDRLFMRLYYEKELAPEEIADIMNVSVSTVYSKKNRIREKLKKILTEKGLIA